MNMTSSIRTRSTRLVKNKRDKKDGKEEKLEKNKKEYSTKEDEGRKEIDQKSIIERSTEIEQEKGEEWNDLNIVENQLKELQSRYTKTNIKTNQEKMSKLINAYEKQVKAILIKIKIKDRKTEETKKVTYSINDEDDLVEEEVDNKSIMSDITNKTSNGKKEETNKEKNSYRQIMKSPERNTHITTQRLESLGKIRKTKGNDVKPTQTLLTPVKKKLLPEVTQEEDAQNKKKEFITEGRTTVKNPYSTIKSNTPKKIKKTNMNDFKTAREFADKEASKEKEASVRGSISRTGELPMKKNTFAEILKGNGECGQTSKEENSTKEKERNKHQNSIRIRTQFKGPARGGSKVGKLKKIVYDMMQIAKSIDPSAACMTWKKKSTHKTLNGNEIMLMNEKDVEEYIEVPQNDTNLYTGKIYYQNGMRIKTKMSIYEFTERWNNKKYDRSDNQNLEGWNPIKPAEMQKHETAYAIGYFVGTSERGYYETIKKEIENRYGEGVEASYQFVNQQGVSARIWQQARMEAEKFFPNPNSKDHKHIKFGLAPSALVIYVSENKQIKQMRRKFIEDYGILENGRWQKMSDGSRLRFVPIIQGYTKNKKTYEHLHEHLWLQAISKSGEVSFDLRITDITEAKEYLEGKTIEQVIHEIESKNKKNIPLFKHISRKWSKQPEQEKYEVTVAPSLVDEAAVWLKGMRNVLIHRFGQGVRKHFDDYNIHHTGSSTRNIRKGNYARENYDEDVESYILSMTNNDQYTKVLIEGMDIVTQDEEKEKGKGNESNQKKMMNNATSTKSRDKVHIMESVKECKEEDGTSDESNDSFKSTKEDEEEGSPREKNKKENDNDKGWDDSTWERTKNTAKWEEMTIMGEVEDMVPCNEKETEKVQNTIRRYNITTEEIEGWKNENWNKYDKMLDEVKRKEYDVMKKIVNDIRQNRLNEEEDDRENSVLIKLMELSKKETKAKEMIHLMDGNATCLQTNQESGKGVNHPKNTGQSPPTNMKKSGEGRRI